MCERRLNFGDPWDVVAVGICSNRCDDLELLERFGHFETYGTFWKHVGTMEISEMTELQNV